MVSRSNFWVNAMGWVESKLGKRWFLAWVIIPLFFNTLSSVVVTYVQQPTTPTYAVPKRQQSMSVRMWG